MKITRFRTRQATQNSSKRFQSLLRYTVSLLSFALIGLTAESAGDAARYFQEGRYDDALEVYRQLSLENPDDARFTYNAGVAAYKAGQLAEAIDQFEAASLAPDLEIQQQAHYNLGNTFYRAGESTDDFEQKTAAWKQAVQRYQHALTINEADSLAQDNLNFVKQRIEELEQQQQEQQQQDQNQDQENENEDSEQDSSSESNSDQEQEQNSSDQQNNEQEQHENEQEQNQSQDGEQEQEQGKQDPQQQDPSEAQQSEQNPDQQDPSEANQAQEGKMTPEQAKRLLDAERDQAKAMIFRPPESKKSRNRRFKDW